MSTQRSRTGPRPRRTQNTTIDRAPALDTAAALAPEPTAPGADAQLFDDVATPIAGQRGLRLGRSLTGAVVGTLLVVGLTFGAALGPGGAFGPKDDGATGNGETAVLTGDAGHAGEGADGDKVDGGYGDDGDGKDGEWVDPEATAKPDGDGTGDAEPTDKPHEPDPTVKPEPDPTVKPEPEHTPKPTERPDPTKDPSEPIGLELAIVEHHPKVAWGSCDGLDFDYYKVVRSTDATVSWPAGEGDEVIAVVERGGVRRAYDKYSPHGMKLFYRVFCVRKGEDGYKVVNASATRAIWVPEEPAPPPSPDPISLEIGFTVTEEGKVVLTWSACEVDGFAFYKVVKSTWNENPSYYPWTDGTEVIGVVEDAHATEWHDWAPDSGHTAYYRVQCLGYWGDQKVLLGQSAVVTVTTP